jgi:hypothetical protein
MSEKLQAMERMRDSIAAAKSMKRLLENELGMLSLNGKRSGPDCPVIKGLLDRGDQRARKAIEESIADALAVMEQLTDELEAMIVLPAPSPDTRIEQPMPDVDAPDELARRVGV